MLSSAPMLMGVAFLMAFVLALLACSPPAQDSEGDLYVSSSVPLQRTDPLDSRIDASICLSYGYPLAYQMAQAVVIVRARLVSVTTGIEVWDSVNDIREAFGAPDEITYFGILEHTFAVVEYLKGTGGDEIMGVVVAENDARHVSTEKAEQDAQQLLHWRDKRWDGREAILFLNAAHPHFVEFPRDDRYMLGRVFLGYFGCGWGYTISSRFEKGWLPAASAALGASTASGSGRFLLDYPEEFGFDWFGRHRPAPSITLSKLKTMIKIVEQCSLLREFGGFREFNDCLGTGYPWYPPWFFID